MERGINNIEPGKVRKILFNEVSLIIAVCGVVLSGFIQLTDPTKDNESALQLQDQRITYQQGVIDKLTQTQQNDMSKSKKCHDNHIDLCIIDTSHQKYFKESTSQQYINIIVKIIKERMLN